MEQFNFTNEHFYNFSIIALDYSIRKFDEYKKNFSKYDWEILRSGVIRECDKIINYSVTNDDIAKAKQIKSLAEFEGIARIFRKPNTTINHFEFEALKYAPPALISVKDIEKYKQIELNKNKAESHCIEKTPQPDISESNKQFDKNHFNKFTFELFEYLVNKYTKKGNIKFINIWYFLKRDRPKELNIKFNFTQDEFKEFIRKRTKNEIVIKKFAKSEFKYDETELPILNDLTSDFTQIRDNSQR